MSLGLMAVLAAIGIIGAIAVRVRRLMPHLNVLIPWLAQVGLSVFCILWCIIFMKISHDATEVPSPMGNAHHHELLPQLRRVPRLHGRADEPGGLAARTEGEAHLMTPSPSAAATPAPGGPALRRLLQALESTVLGQPHVVADLVTAFLARGHVLLEGVPGVAKTLTARSIASALGLGFTRVQFTPDLMPSDILGTNVFRPQDNAFQLVKGPVFTEVLVADEINRTPPKTQAALLEAMEERQVTIDGTTHPLPPHFFVVATQNPLELEGTYPLPEAQLDRFLMRVRVGYPPPEAELDMVRGFHQREGKSALVERVLDAPDPRWSCRRGPRASPATSPCSPTWCSSSARRAPTPACGWVPHRARPRRCWRRPRPARPSTAADFVTPDDVKAVCPSVLNHRLLLKAEAEVEGLTADDVLRQTLERVQVPR